MSRIGAGQPGPRREADEYRYDVVVLDCDGSNEVVTVPASTTSEAREMAKLAMREGGGSPVRARVLHRRA